jgi:peptide-methionine (S)-S-oxide reductase
MTEIATFAAGCFWGVEHAFRQIEGVIDAEVGYTGGHMDNPTYEAVCRKGTGHAEAVRVTFDPEIVSYDDLLELFWTLHDPTQVNRQGPDVGDQYRSAIFTHSEAQTKAAAASKEAQDASGAHGRPIATIIEPAGKWWKAENYHQRYFEKNGLGACAVHPR